MQESYVYILANKRNGTLYVGVTADLIDRIWQHKQNLTPGFTTRYKVTNLVYYEIYTDITEAIAREKLLKKWRRVWKLKLIERMNPNWVDLYDLII